MAFIVGAFDHTVGARHPKSSHIYNNLTGAVPLLRLWVKCMKTAVSDKSQLPTQQN